MASPFHQSPQNNKQNTQTQSPSENELHEMRSTIFKEAMRRKWNKVRDLYKRDKVVRYQKITRAGDTVLHVAISGAQQPTILELLKVIVEDSNEVERDKILYAKNNNGDTSLHLAAEHGLEKVCHEIAHLEPEMVTTARNKLQETPLFTAVRHGKKNAFFVLEAAIYDSSRETTYKDPTLTDKDLWLYKRDFSHCRGYDGNNILHYAIKGEQFDLALEIIYLYPELVHCVNTSGESALHTLANKPSVFQSGTRLGFFDNIFYFSSSLPTGRSKGSGGPDEENQSSSLRSGICKCRHPADEENQSGPQNEDEYKTSQDQKHRWFPPNYEVPFSFFKIFINLLLVVLGIGLRKLCFKKKIEKLRQQHEDAVTIMKKLVSQSRLWEYEDASGGKKPTEQTSVSLKEPPQVTAEPTEDASGGKKPTEQTSVSPMEASQVTAKPTDEASPVLVAAKMGIKEMVQNILEYFPVAILDQDKDGKNIGLLAAEHRQVHVYKFLLTDPDMKENIFRKADKKGNSALHHAAMLSDIERPWSIPGAALQMHWEMKWYKYVLSSMKQEMLPRTNNEGKTAHEKFTESHETLIKDARKWLTDTSQSCSVVAALVATVAFASASTVPGGVDTNSGSPVLVKRPAFQLFAIASLIALCFSVTSLVMFLAILTSRYQVRDFKWRLPVMLILGLTSLFMSIASMLVSFCAGDFFVVDKSLKFATYPIYAVMCFPVTIFAIAQFPLYIDLIKATIKKVPESTEKMQDY